MPNELWWLTPLISLAAAIVGGLVVAWANGLLADRTVIRSQLREARTALESHVATLRAPGSYESNTLPAEVVHEYDAELQANKLRQVGESIHRARVSLSSIRHVAPMIGEILDRKARPSFTDQEIIELRALLNEAETKTWKPFARQLPRNARKLGDPQ